MRQKVRCVARESAPVTTSLPGRFCWVFWPNDKTFTLAEAGLTLARAWLVTRRKCCSIRRRAANPASDFSTLEHRAHGERLAVGYGRTEVLGECGNDTRCPDGGAVSLNMSGAAAVAEA